jgi:hypothetical protein
MLQGVIQVSLNAQTPIDLTGVHEISTSTLVILPPFNQTVSAQTSLSTLFLEGNGYIQALISRYRSGSQIVAPVPNNIINDIPDCVFVTFTLSITPLAGAQFLEAMSVGTIFIQG